MRASLKTKFIKMIDSVTERTLGKDVQNVERARAFLTKSFGSAEKWANINISIWSSIDSRKDRAFNISDVNAVAELTSSDGGEVLAALALLSSPSVSMLTMDFQAGDGTPITKSEFIRKLKEWWKHKSLSEAEWRAWASDVKVRWIPISEEKHGNE